MMRRLARWILVLIFLSMLGANLLTPYPYERQFREATESALSSAHPLATDAVGRDRLSRLLYGGRVSMLLAPAAALVSVAIALLAGVGAAAFGRWWTRSASIVIDLFLSLPWLFLLLAVRAMLPLNVSPGVSIVITFALLGLLGWPGPARVMMASAERQVASEYVVLGRATGASAWRVAARHVLPQLRPVASAQFWTTAPAFLLAEANLSLMGLGIAEPLPSWGNLLCDLQNYTSWARDPAVLAPLVLLVLTLSCFQLARKPDEVAV